MKKLNFNKIICILVLCLFSCQKSTRNVQKDNSLPLEKEINYLLEENTKFRSIDNQNTAFIIAEYLKNKDKNLIAILDQRYKKIKQENDFNSMLLDFLGEKKNLEFYTNDFMKSFVIRVIYQYGAKLKYRFVQIQKKEKSIFLSSKTVKYDIDCTPILNRKNLSKNCFTILNTKEVEIKYDKYLKLLNIINESGIKYQVSRNIVESEVCMGGSYFQINVLEKINPELVSKYKVTSYCTQNKSPSATIAREILKISEE